MKHSIGLFRGGACGKICLLALFKRLVQFLVGVNLRSLDGGVQRQSFFRYLRILQNSEVKKHKVFLKIKKDFTPSNANK